jgi:hypothetical protein
MLLSVLIDTEYLSHFTSLHHTVLPGPCLQPNWPLRQPAHVLLAAVPARLLQNMQRQVFRWSADFPRRNSWCVAPWALGGFCTFSWFILGKDVISKQVYLSFETIKTSIYIMREETKKAISTKCDSFKETFYSNLFLNAGSFKGKISL